MIHDPSFSNDYQIENIGTSSAGIEDTKVEVVEETETDAGNEPVEVEETDTTQEETEEVGTEVSETSAQEVETHKRKTGSQREKERRKALEDKLARMEAELRAVKAGNYQATGNTSQPTPSNYNPNVAPILSDFNTLEEFLEARDAHRDHQVKKQEQTKSWEKKETEAKAKYEDFDDMVEDFVSLRPPVFIVDAIMESPIGPELVYYLGSNLDEVKKLSKLSPARQAVELGKLELKLTPKEEKKVVAPKSKAPAPISPVRPTTALPTKKTNNDGYKFY